MLLAIGGMGLVYLIVWRQGRIYTRLDLESRLGVRVLGDFEGRPADTTAIVLALTKGRESATRALVMPVSGAEDKGADGLGSALATAARELGMPVTLGSADQPNLTRVSSAAAVESASTNTVPTVDNLALIEARDGLDAKALAVASNVHVVALAITYGKTSYRDLNEVGQTLADATDADIAVIGVRLQP